MERDLNEKKRPIMKCLIAFGVLQVGCSHYSDCCCYFDGNNSSKEITILSRKEKILKQ